MVEVGCAFTTSFDTCETGRSDCNGDSSDGCEIDLQYDSHNCGSCGRDCRGGQCYLGLCQSIILAQGMSPRSILIDDATVYWLDGPPCASGTVMSVPKTGGTATVLAQTNGYPDSLVRIDRQLFWLIHEGAIDSLSLDGGASTRLLSFPVAGQGAYNLATNGTYAAWVACEEAGCDIACYVPGALNQENLTLQRLDGTMPPSVLGMYHDTFPQALMNETRLYWAVPAQSGFPLDGKRGLWIAALDTGETKHTLTENVDERGLAIADGRIVWADLPDRGGYSLPCSLHSADLLGNLDPNFDVRFKCTPPFALLSDAEGLYWFGELDPSRTPYAFDLPSGSRDVRNDGVTAAGEGGIVRDQEYFYFSSTGSDIAKVAR